MSVAPEIAILAEASMFVPAQPAARQPRDQREPREQQAYDGPPALRPTLGTLARHLRLLAAAPERWWGLVRFDPDRSVRIQVEDQPGYRAWLVVLPPAQAGQQSAGQDCDCDVATVIAGEATDGGPGVARCCGRDRRGCTASGTGCAATARGTRSACMPAPSGSASLS